MEINREKSELIGQGTYGCIFKPDINEKGETESNTKYISKLELSGDRLENEINIDKKVQSITNYEEYFSPILEKHSIELKEIKKEQPEILDCEVTKDSKDNTPIFLEKIKYIGKNSLENYLSIMKRGEPKKFLELFLETQVILLESLEKLNQIGIIHNDLKEDNIICRDEDGRPIIIDFGLSMDNEYMFLSENIITTISSIFTQNTIEKTKENEKTSQLKRYFFKYEPRYEVWCIDIIIINYILNILKKEEIPLPKPENIIKLIEDYIKNNKIFEKIKEEEKDIFKKDLIEELTKDSFKTWENLLETLLTYQKTWDNYGLSIVYLKLLKIHEEYIRKQMGEKYDEYINILKLIILSKPSERRLPEETMQNILQVFQKIKREQFM